jgi:hypothetical protein
VAKISGYSFSGLIVRFLAFAEPLHAIEHREELLEAKRLLAAASVSKGGNRNLKKDKTVTRPSYRETVTSVP